MDIEAARALLLTLPDTEEYMHFGKPAYRLRPKGSSKRPGRTCITLWPEEGHVVLMLDQEQQADLISRYPSVCALHPSKWGVNGATVLHLAQANARFFEAAVQLALAHGRRP
jgi:hypothetical protein